MPSTTTAANERRALLRPTIASLLPSWTRSLRAEGKSPNTVSACPGSQIPWLVASFPARPGAEPPGSASLEAAFRKANPAVTEFTTYLWSVSQPVRGDDPRISIFMPIWIVAGNETFVAHAVSFGPMNEPHGWFAFPAKFMGCITGSQPSSVPRR